MENKFNILLIEDNLSDALVVDMYLSNAYDDGTYTLTCAYTLSAGINFISQKKFNIILLDLNLPDSSGLDTFKKVFEKSSETPIIVLSGSVNEKVGINAMKLGAQDFLFKGKMLAKELRRSINYSIERNELLKQLSEKTKKIENHTAELLKEKTKMNQAQKLALIGSWEWDITNSTISWSDQLYEIYGLKQGEFEATAEAFLSRVHKSDREYTKRIIKNTYKTLVPFDFYHRIVRPNNEIRIIHAKGEVIKDEEGNSIIMSGTGQDVTERVREEEMEKLALAATKSFNSVIVADNNGNIEWVNEGYTKLSGYTLEDIFATKKSLFKMLDGGFQNGNTISKTPISYERECISKKGKKYWVISTITPVLDKNGDIERIIAIDTDITHRKHIEAELLRINQVKEQFLANMSHEIRTPMNAIIGFTELLLKTELSIDQKQYLDAVRTSGKNLLVIINDILDFTKIESGKITFEQIDFDLRHLISSLTEFILPKSIEKNIRVSTKIDTKIPKQLIGDPTRLNQVMLNLVSNAIKFTNEGEIKICANFVKEDIHSVDIRLSVSDSGIGIPENKLEDVFEGFTQATNDTNRKYGGTGLGLTIVKQLVELQGGTISVKSKLGKGTIFTINLNFGKSQATQIIQNIALDNSKNLTHIENLNILLVEDNILNQLLAKKVLSNWKWNVDTAENGLAAVQKIKNRTYDIVLMDIQMPEMDGYEATRLIRKKKNSEKNNVPIIAMTAHAISGEAEKCYKAGMNDYISKPFDENILYEKIITVCKTPFQPELNTIN